MKRKSRIQGLSSIIRYTLFAIAAITFLLPCIAHTEVYQFVSKWGSLGSGYGRFYSPYGVALDTSGNVYVADTGNHRIQKFTSAGAFITEWGTQGAGDGSFNSPYGVAVDSSGNIYVADTGNHRIQKFGSNYNFITQWGTQGSGDGSFDIPWSVAVDSSGNAYVADTGNNRIQKFDSNGNFITQWGSLLGPYYSRPQGVAVDALGNVYMTDTGNSRIQKFDSNGNFITKWGSEGGGDGQFIDLRSVAVDSSGNVYVTDIGSRIQKFDSNGNFITKWGSSGAGDGQFIDLRGVAVDSSMNVYVADILKHCIQKFKPIYNLYVNKTGTGTGSVTVNAGTLVWNGNIGSASYDKGASVTLTAIPGAYTTFIGWVGGGCSGKGTCTTALNGDTYVRAVFSGQTESVWSWGGNGSGQLGNGTNTNSSTPVLVGGLGNVIAIAGGASHTVALKSDGTVWAWGWNNTGQLGNGTNTNSSTPVQVSGLGSVIAVTAGQSHTIALKSDGTAWRWGANSINQTYTSSNTPVQMSGLGGVVAVAAGKAHTIALKSDGTVWAWGDNTYGQLGNGTYGEYTSSGTPVQVIGLRNVIAVAGGDIHSMALKADGTVWTWGDNGFLNYSSIPGQVSSLGGVVAVAAGHYLSMVLKSDGTVWTWGWNNTGQLGNGNNTSSSTPVQASGLGGVIAVAAGYAHAVVLKADGTVWAWGENGFGEIGNGTTTTSNIPVKASGLGSVIAVAGGNRYSIALKWANYSLTVQKAGSGNGTVTSSPAGITCGGDCVENYTIGGSATLTAVPDSESVFNGWSGEGCIGTGTCAVAMDAAAAKTVTATFTDIKAPAGSIVINGGADITNSVNVNLALSCTDASSGCAGMQFSNDGGTNYTEWEPFSQTKQWTLPEGTGVKTVHVKFRDGTPNESVPYSDTITLDSTPPVPVIAFPSNNTAVISVLEIQGTVSDIAPSSGLSKIEIAVSQNTQLGTYYLQSDKSTWSTIQVYHLATLTPEGSWSFSVGNIWESQQSYTVTVRATDNMGNISSVSSTFTYIVQMSAFTTLTMDVSSQTILNKGGLVVTGKLSRLPEVNMDLRNLSISLDVTSPSGAKIPVAPTLTGVDGSYTFTFPDNNTVFTEKGTYALQARFNQTGSLAASASDIKPVLVGASAGYAILVQGKLAGPNPEGLASHNKTTNRVYKTLRNRGFDDLNILYFNYTKPQTDVVVDEIPSKEGVQSAIKGDGIESAIKGWASGKMNSVPAPLYIIMVNHGDPNAFHIGDATISPAELSSWLNSLEASLNQEAKKEKIIVVLGACYSGSFIPQLSKSNRIIVTSAAADEESYKGPLEGSVDNIRSGEYFIDALFVQLGRGYSLKDSFEEATRETEEYTRKGGASANTPNAYFDTAMQHPLLDDNGDIRGSNVLAQGQGDGQAAKDVYLGTGVTYDTNAARVEIIGVTETKYLNVSDSSALLWLKVSNPVNVSSAWAIIRPPSLDLSQNQTASSYQRDINLTPQPMPWNQSTGRYELTYTGFTEPGMYEIFYYIIETGTPAAVSPLKRSVVYKNKVGNTAPTAPTLVKPTADEVTRTTLVFQWNASIDSDPVTYNLVIATDSGFTNVVHRKDGIKSTMTSVDASAGLKDLTTYYWRVEAVDGYTFTASVWRKFKTDNTNGLPGILTGIVFSDRDYSLITMVTIQVTVNSTPVSVDQAADGSFVLSSLPGTATLEVTATGYEPLTVSDVTVVAGDTTPINIGMVPVAGQKGDLTGDGYVTIADAILALRVLSGMPPLETLYRDAALASGRIGIADVIYILQKVAGVRQQ